MYIRTIDYNYTHTHARTCIHTHTCTHIHTHTHTGESESDCTQLLKNHDAFEKTTNRIYALASQLFAKATQLANSGQCNPDLIGPDSSALEEIVSAFASRLDTRREIILQAQEVFKKMEQVK